MTPHFTACSSTAQGDTSPEPPALSLTAYLALANAAATTGLPRRSWVEATVARVVTHAYSHSLELTEADAAGPAVVQMHVLLDRDIRMEIGRDIGTIFDPTLLIGMTLRLLLASSISSQGHLQARIDAIGRDARASLGRLFAERLREDLHASGLMDRQRALAAPADLTRIGVVHPSGAGADADIADAIQLWQRTGRVTVSTHEAPFAGPRAAAFLVAALMAAAMPIDGTRPDVILLISDGAATVDLQALDREMIVRALCRCPVPVITGLGHANNRTLVDEVAWRAADTPREALALMTAAIGASAAHAREISAIRGDRPPIISRAVDAIDTTDGSTPSAL